MCLTKTQNNALFWLKKGNSYAIKLLKILRRNLSGVSYCAGGVHPTALPESTLNELDLNFVVVGESENTPRDICNRFKGKNRLDLEGIEGVVYKHDKEVIYNGMRPLIEDLDSIPIPDRGLLQDYWWYLSPPGNIRGKIYKGIARIIATRGCPYHCIFCSSHQIFGRKVRKMADYETV